MVLSVGPTVQSAMDLQSSADTYDGVSEAGATPQKKRGRPCSAVEDGLGDRIDAANVAKARKTIRKAMQDDSTAVRLAFLIDSNQLERKKKHKDGPSKVLASCCNKWCLVSRPDCVELLMEMEPDLDQEKVDLMPKSEAQGLVAWSQGSKVDSALPTKFSSSSKRIARPRMHLWVALA